MNLFPENLIFEGEFLSIDFFLTLFSGQTFSWNYIQKKNLFIGVHNQSIIVLKLSNSNKREIMWQTYPKKNRFDLVQEYFDLNNSKKYIKSLLEISKKDNFTLQSVNKYHGLRILHQNVYETAISFIMSQNRSMKITKKVLDNLRYRYGEKIHLEEMGEYAYLYPPADILLESITISDLKNLNFGYRAEYFISLLKAIVNYEIPLSIRNYSLKEFKSIKESLVKIKGIGNKVADCILVFGYGYRHITPIDVWGYRIISEDYKVSLNKKSYDELSSWYTNKFNNNTALAGLLHFEYKRNKRKSN